MKPLNFAILKHFTTVEKASAADVIDALKADYGSYRPFTPKGVLESIMTAEKNGLLEVADYMVDEKGELIVYYCAHAEGAEAINKYIK